MHAFVLTIDLFVQLYCLVLFPGPLAGVRNNRKVLRDEHSGVRICTPIVRNDVRQLAAVENGVPLAHECFVRRTARSDMGDG